MKTWNEQLSSAAGFAALILVLVLSVTACADRTETVRRETVSEPVGTSSAYVEEETVVREEVDDGETTVLGTVFNVVGEVIALPFRIVAGVFRFVF